MSKNADSQRILHVAQEGHDTNDGSERSPLRTISAAAEIAMPGDTVQVHAGTYREAIHPRRGGSSDAERITYEAAPGEAVEILGSEIITGWEPEPMGRAGTWRATVSNAVFGDYNPFAELINGDWFLNMGRPHHTGSVYFRGREFQEATTWERLQAFFWYAEVAEKYTTIWLNCGERDPNGEKIEINVRPTVFYPNTNGINYITVRGFTMRHAATNWAPPTAEQPGLIGTNWSKGWIIENNVITHSRCVGVTLGKYGDEYDNTSEDSAEGFVATIKRAYARGWHRDNIGSHIVRNNVIAYCEQAGIAGSLGAVFSEVSGNVIHDIHSHRLFKGEEQAGIKLHAPIDSLIAGNHIYRCNRALWMDWMTQGTRITRNLCHDNTEEDLFVEVSHGPFIVDHNLFLSHVSVSSMSQGGAFLHNLFGGNICRIAELGRATPYQRQSSVEIAGMATIRGGDERYMNNIFMNANALESSSGKLHKVRGKGKVPIDPDKHKPYPSFLGNNQVVSSSFTLREVGGRWSIHFNPHAEKFIDCPIIKSEILGNTQESQLPYCDYNAQPLVLNKDYCGYARDESGTIPGPFATLPHDPTDFNISQERSAARHSVTSQSEYL